jgi:VanZ family protein
MNIRILAIICVAVLCITLTLGLWPFHAPRNDVAWLKDHAGLRFGRVSTVFSSSAFQSASPNSPGASMEIWLQPGLIWDSNTFLSLYSSKTPLHFSLRQSQTDLLLQTPGQDDHDHTTLAKLYVAEVFRKLQPVFITITSGERGTVVYLDGVPVKTAPQFRISAKAFTGRLIVGDSPGQTDSWSGRFLGLAMYHRELMEPQVLRNYAAWKRNGRPELTMDERNVALYLFDEHTGSVVRDKAGSGVDLYIPKTYAVVDQIFLEPFWTEFGMTRSYFGAAFKNIVGFIPFGFCFYAYITTVFSIQRATLLTVALGTAVSLTIEILQAYLPTRDSGTTDLITNTLGAWIGVVSYKIVTPALARIFPWAPAFFAPER